MPPALKIGRQKDVDDLFHQPFADHALPERKHIGVVVQPRIFCGIGVVAMRAADPRHLVGDKRNADARSADEDPALAPPRRDGFRRRQRVIGIIAGFFRVRAEVDHFMPFGCEVSHERPLELQPAMVAGDSDLHIQPP